MCGSKWILRTVVIAGLVGGAAVLIAGPKRLGMLVHQTRCNINEAIDSRIEDPVLLRSQLRDLEAQYPPRIAAVRADLAQVREQLAQLKREQSVCARVVDLAQNDLASLQGMIARAEGVQATQAAIATVSQGDQPPAPASVVRINFSGESLSVDQAVAKAGRVEQVVSSYGQRTGEIERDLGVMAQQETRLNELCEKLEAERAEFQAQLWQLDHQIDTIARNNRMIDLMEKRQKTIDEHSFQTAGSLDHVRGRIAEINAKQDAQLESLGKVQTGNTYEAKARVDVDGSKRLKPLTKGPKPKVIEISPTDPVPASDAPKGQDPKSVAINR